MKLLYSHPTSCYNELANFNCFLVEITWCLFTLQIKIDPTKFAIQNFLIKTLIYLKQNDITIHTKKYYLNIYF